MPLKIIYLTVDAVCQCGTVTQLQTAERQKVQKMKKLMVFVLLAIVAFVSGCSTDAQVASRNMAKKAEMFEIERRIVFLNGITDSYILSIEGRCSIEQYSGKIKITCKTGDNSFKQHQMGLSDNVTYFSEQLESSDVSVYRYKVIFKPSVIIPDIDLSTILTD